MTEIPELKEIEVKFDGQDIAALMVMSCQNIITGMAILLNILQRRGIPDNDPEVSKMRDDYHEYLERFEVAIKIQAKLQEIKNPQKVNPVKPEDVGYG